MTLAEIRKALIPFVTTVIAFATVVLASESAPVTSDEWLGLAIGLAVAAGVYVVPNADSRA